MVYTTIYPPVPPIPKKYYMKGKLDMEENKKIATAEGSVQQQPKENIIEEQLCVLKKAQQVCFNSGNFDSFVAISKLITVLIILSRNQWRY